MSRSTYTYEFVEFIPETLEDGVLYVSVEYATTSHLCMCDCGSKVVTPLTRHDWRMTYDGETVSLSPSIGNWSFACQTHYFLRDGRVDWARKWSDEEIKFGRSVAHRKSALLKPEEELSVKTADVERLSWLRRRRRRTHRV